MKYKNYRPIIRHPNQNPTEEGIYTKKRFYEMFQRGVFGNRGPSWESLDEMFSDPYYTNNKPKVAIRTKVASGHCRYNIPYSTVRKVWKTFLAQGYKPETMQLSEMCPYDPVRIQVYVCQSTNHYDMQYSYLRVPMRKAMEKGQQNATGLEAKRLLKTYMCDNSYAWLQELFDNFPNCVVEFTTFGIQWGVCPGYNTVFWEVRNF